MSAIQISVSYALSSQFVSRTVYATYRPSGEISGEATRFRDRIPSTVGATVDCAINVGVARSDERAYGSSFFIDKPTSRYAFGVPGGRRRNQTGSRQAGRGER